jgi:low affinity Fe/Cu permease
MHELFHRFAARISALVGSSWAFVLAVVIVAVWGVSGPLFHFSDTWQLVINTGTTIITFLMVFLIQNTQNRDSKAIHLKLDELIASMDRARNRLIDLEDCSDDELNQLEDEFKAVREKRIRSSSNGAEAGRARAAAR